MNAKELVLEKINASPELAGIYIYMLMTGIQFEDAANYMTSPIISKVLAKARKSIYDNSTLYSNVKLAINYYRKGVNLGSYVYNPRKVAGIEMLFEAYAKQNNIKNTDFRVYISELSSVELEKFRKDFTAVVPTEVPEANAVKLYRMTEDDYNFSLDNGDEGDYADNLDAVEANPTTYVKKKEVDNTKTYLFRFFEAAKSRALDLESMTDKDLSLKNLDTLELLHESAQELTILGRGGSLNLGMKTKMVDKLSFEKLIEEYINSRLNTNKRVSLAEVQKEVQNKKTGELETKIVKVRSELMNKYGVKGNKLFDFELYTTNDEYRKDISELYEVAKDTINVLAIWNGVPHFTEMFKAYGVTHLVMSTFLPVLYKLLRKLLKELDESELIKLNDPKKVRIVDLYLLDVLTFKYLTNFSRQVTLVAGNPMYVKGLLSSSPNTRSLEFANPDDLATFKVLVERVYTDILKLKYPGNLFVQGLIADIAMDPYGRSMSVIRLPLDVESSDKTAINAQLGLLILDFNKIRTDMIPNIGMTVLDMFFLYNLVVNSNRPGNKTLTNIFLNVLDTEDSIARDHMLYVAKMDISDKDYNKLDLYFRLLDNKLEWNDYSKNYSMNFGEFEYTLFGKILSMNTYDGAIKLPILAKTSSSIDKLLTLKVQESLLRLAVLNQLEIKLRCDE